MTKAPIPTEMSKGQSDNTNNATKKPTYIDNKQTATPIGEDIKFDTRKA